MIEVLYSMFEVMRSSEGRLEECVAIVTRTVDSKLSIKEAWVDDVSEAQPGCGKAARTLRGCLVPSVSENNLGD